MNPGITSAASSATFPPSGFTPEFFKPLPPPAAGVRDEGISFPLHAGQTIDEFQKAPKFPAFKQEFLTHIESMTQFATENLGDEAHGVNVAFNEFSEKMFGTEIGFFEGEEDILYGVGKRSFEQFSRQLGDDNIDLTHRKTCVVELAAGIQQCAGGAVVNLAEATQILQAAHESQFLRARNDVVMALINEAYYLLLQTRPVPFTLSIGGKVVDHVPPTFEIHCFTSLRNAVVERLGLKIHIDSIADHCKFSPEAIAYCQNHVSKNLTPATLAGTLAEEYLQAFRLPVVEALTQSAADKAKDAGLHDADLPFSYRKWSGQLSTAMVDLKGYGEIGISSLVTPVDPEYRKVRLNTDSTLVALDIIDTQRRKGALAASYLPQTVVRWREGKHEFKVRHLSEQLAWAVENGDMHLLNLKHLVQISPKDFNGRENIARLIVANVVKNSTPEMLQSQLPVEWLSILDTATLFSKWQPGALTRYLKRHAIRLEGLPRLRRLAIAIGIVACGTPSDLDLCIRHGRILFEPSLKGTLPPAFFGVALLRGDIPMFGKLVERLNEGMGKSTRISAQVGAIIAAADPQGVVATAETLRHAASNPVLPAYYAFATRMACDRLMSAEQLEEVLAAKSKRGTPGLIFAMQNDDHEKMRQFSAAIATAFTLGVLDSSRCARLLSAASTEGVSALVAAMYDDRSDSIMAFGDIVMEMCALKAINSAQVFALLSTQIWDNYSAFACAAEHGKSAGVQALGKVIDIAIEKQVLSSAQAYRLLLDHPASTHQLTGLALCSGHLDTANTFADLFVGFYNDDVLSRDQLRVLLSARTREGLQALIATLMHDEHGEVAVATLGDLIIAVESAIRRKNDLPFFFLTASEASPRDDLNQLAEARSTENLKSISAIIRELHEQVESDQPIPESVLAQTKSVGVEMMRSRIALFFDPGDAADGMQLFAQMKEDWDALCQQFLRYHAKLKSGT